MRSLSEALGGTNSVGSDKGILQTVYITVQNGNTEDVNDYLVKLTRLRCELIDVKYNFNGDKLVGVIIEYLDKNALDNYLVKQEMKRKHDEEIARLAAECGFID